MLHLIIRFPFSSVNDEQYMLALCLHHPFSLQPALDVLNADSEVFTQGVTTTDEGDTIYNYTGTLQGSVQSADDERDDIFEPIIASKLTFNMVCQTFPEWLMQFCNARWVSVLLYKDNPGVNFELWRGYLVAQSLNMTVVDNLMACNLVAVDEIGMAKYMPVKDTYKEYRHWGTIFNLLAYFHGIHFKEGFTVNGINGVGFKRYYNLLGLDSSGSSMLWKRNMAVISDQNNPIIDLPWQLVVNLDKWIIDGKATWYDVFDAVFRYLCVTFSIGSWSMANRVSHDCYLVTCPTDSGNIKLYSCLWGTDPVEISNDIFETITNPMKIGGDLQVTIEPDKYKSVTIESEPKRWEPHEYLKDDSYKRLGVGVKRDFGETDDPDNGPYNGETYKVRKMRYLRLKDEEADFVEIPECTDGEGLTMAEDGLLPYDNIHSCDGLTHPTAEVANSLDFITFKEGACPIEIGSSQYYGLDEDQHMTPYFLIMNHVWENRWNALPYSMGSRHLYDTKWLAFMPFGKVAALHPADGHYLRISMEVTFIRENFGPRTHPDGPKQWLWEPAPGIGHSMRAVNWNNTTILLPCISSAYGDFEDPNSPYTGTMQGGVSLTIRAIIKCGDWYNDGRVWMYQPQNIPTCPLLLKCDSTEVETDKYGGRTEKIKNYYFEAATPWHGSTLVDITDKTSAFYGMSGLSALENPLDGELEIQILGQINFQNANAGGVKNSVPFLLISDVDISYSDDSELSETDLLNKSTVYIDYYSETKEEMKRKLEMASPAGDGFFQNTLLCNVGKVYRNLVNATAQGSNTRRTPEQMLALKLASQYAGSQCFVEFSTPVHYDDNIHNVDFLVQGLTEVDGTFLPLRRTFDYRLERMRVKMMRVTGSI